MRDQRQAGEEPRRSNRRRLFTALLIAAVAGLAAIVITLSTLVVTTVEGRTSRPTDLEGNPVAVDTSQLPTDAQAAAMHAVDDSGARFQVPSVGLDVLLGEVSEASGSVVPPGFTSVYRVRNLGVSLADADKGTVFVVTHSVRGGGVAPGNYLMDERTAGSTLDAGDVIDVGGLHYKVASSGVRLKSELPTDAEVWADVPGRLVVITCLQNVQQTASTENLVITATLEQ